MRLWSLEDPYLYDVEIKLDDDIVNSYFGIRKISSTNLPGNEYPYVALNNKPIYLQLALDQSYHPDGYYTFPSDKFMKEEILRSKSIGLNGIRIHIKAEIPRKLFWADKLGLLVVEDLPNSWGDPDKFMRSESEYTLKEMIKEIIIIRLFFRGFSLMNSGDFQPKMIQRIIKKTKAKYYQKHTTGLLQCII